MLFFVILVVIFLVFLFLESYVFYIFLKRADLLMSNSAMIMKAGEEIDNEIPVYYDDSEDVPKTIRTGSDELSKFNGEIK